MIVAPRNAACFCSSVVRGSGPFGLVTCHRNSGFYHIFFSCTSCTLVLYEVILLLLRMRITLKRIGIKIRLFTSMRIRIRLSTFDSDPDPTFWCWSGSGFFMQRILVEGSIASLYGFMVSIHRSRIFSFMWIQIWLTPAYGLHEFLYSALFFI